MLTRWKLKGFKSVVDEADLEFKPLTIFTGANNAGKSTVLQSILVLAQTINDQRDNLVVTGDLVALGSVNDITSRISNRLINKGLISIECQITRSDFKAVNKFTFSPSRHTPLRSLSSSLSFLDHEDINNREQEISIIEALDHERRLNYQMYHNLGISKDRVNAVGETLSIQYASIPDSMVTPSRYGHRSTITNTARKALDLDLIQLKGLNPHERVLFLEPTFRIMYVLSRRLNTLHPDPDAALPSQHPLKKTLQALEKHLGGRKYNELIEQLNDRDQPRNRLNPQKILLSPKIESMLLELTDTYLEQNKQHDQLNFQKEFISFIKGDVLDEYFWDPTGLESFGKKLDYSWRYQGRRQFNWGTVKTTPNRLNPINPVFECIDSNDFQKAAIGTLNAIYDSIKNDGWYENIDLSDYFDASVVRSSQSDIYSDPKFQGLVVLNRALSKKVKYLGPLRIPPQGIHRFGGAIDTVGTSGEHTARMLANSIEQRTWSVPGSYLPPRELHDELEAGELDLEAGEFDPDLPFNIERMLQLWLHYLGVANSGTVTSEKYGKGFTYQIKADDASPAVDDRHVGVGISQLMPVLVQGLLSEPWDILIFEQPELHMHPRIQSRLADFFAMLARNHIQCIIETHSEHLIDRLRLLYAKSTDGNESSEDSERKTSNSSSPPDAIIYYATMEAGKTRYQSLEINPYGVIEDWPAGFFDEENVPLKTQIMKAGIEKMLREESR